MKQIVYDLSVRGLDKVESLALLSKQAKESFARAQIEIDKVTKNIAALKKESLQTTTRIKEIEKIFKNLASSKGVEAQTAALEEQGLTVEDLQSEYTSLIKKQGELREETRQLSLSQRSLQRDFKTFDFPADSITALKREYKLLKKEIDILSSSDPLFKKKAEEAEELKNEINRLSIASGDFTQNIGRYEESVTRALEGTGALINGSITDLVKLLGVGGILASGLDLAADGAEIIGNLSEEFIRLRSEARLLTGQTGEDLNQFTANTLALANTFDAEFNEVLTTSNALSKQLGISFDESLGVIQNGFLSAANNSGTLLDDLREYAPFIREAELTTNEFLQILIQSQELGVFSDKGIDSLKEALITLREFPDSAKEAIEGIGLSSEAIRNQIENEGVGAAIKTISAQLATLESDSPAVGTALADIFKSAGEDSGVEFIKSLASIDGNLDSLIDTTDEYTAAQLRTLQAQKRFTNAQAELADAVGSVKQDFETLGQEVLANVLTAIVKFINTIKAIPQFVQENRVSLLALGTAILSFNSALIASQAIQVAAAARTKALTIATNAQVAAQRILNLAMRANPFSLFVTAVSIAVGSLAALYNRSLEVRSVINGLGATAQEFFSIIKESFTSFAQGFEQARNLDFAGALSSFGTALKKSNPLAIAFTEGERLKKAYGEGYEKTKIDSELAASEKQISNAVQQIGELKDDATQAGKNVADGLADGISNNSNNVVQAVQKMQSEIDKFSVDALQNALSQLNTELTQTSDENIIRDKLLEIAQTQEQLKEIEETTERIRAEIARDNEPTPTAAPTIATLDTPNSVTSLEDGIITDDKAINEAAKNANQKAIQEELDARKKRNEEIEKLEKEKQDIVLGATEAIGSLVGTALTGQVEDFKDFQKQILLIALDALEKFVLLKIAEITARQLASKGLIGLATSAVLVGLVKGATAGLRSVVNNLEVGGVVDITQGGVAKGDRHSQTSGGIQTVDRHRNKTSYMIENGEAVVTRKASLGKSLAVISHLNHKAGGQKMAGANPLTELEKRTIDDLLLGSHASDSYLIKQPTKSKTDISLASTAAMPNVQILKPFNFDSFENSNAELVNEVKELKKEMKAEHRADRNNNSKELQATRKELNKVALERDRLKTRLKREQERKQV